MQRSTILLLAAILGESVATAAPIRWIPSKLTVTVGQGEARTTVVRFTSEERLSDITAFVSADLAPFVSVEPSAFTSLRPGEDVDITLTLSAPLEAPLGTLNGYLQLRDGAARLRRSYSRPLPISMTVEPAASFEEFPAWSMPNLTVERFVAEPERLDPLERATLRATVLNSGTGTAESAVVIFAVDGREIDRLPVKPLVSGEATQVTGTWRTERAGRHVCVASVEPGAGDPDMRYTDNSRAAMVYVSGEDTPRPAISFGNIDFPALQLTPGGSHTLSLSIRNPSLVPLRRVPTTFFIDGEPVRARKAGSTQLPGDLELDLAPGEELEVQVPWSDVTPGTHIITVKSDLPETYEDVSTQPVKSWCAVVPDETILYETPAQDKWVSAGPRILTGVPAQPHTHFGKEGNVGRIDRIALHPSDPSIAYAGAPTGGLWKTTNGGDSWTPLGDKWPSLRVGDVALDPKHPQIVYVATGTTLHKGGTGIFKSVDGGKSWYIFASTTVAKGASHLVIRYLSQNEFVIYAAADTGLLRYGGSDPWATKSTPQEWTQIKGGLITDLAVSPTDNSLVYVSLINKVHSSKLGRAVHVFSGLYRTRSGATAVDVADAGWELITTGLPDPFGSGDPIAKPRALKMDIFQADPKYLYAALQDPLGGDGTIGTDLPFLGIYQSINEGDSWFLWEYVYPNNRFNDFIRVHPTKSHLVFFGGVHFFMRDLIAEGSPVHIDEIHDDTKTLEFDPFDPDFYWVTTDAGIWRCKVGSIPNCVHRNNDLRVTQFYDLDVSPVDSGQMIGGTQDNGTILYVGGDDWKIIRGGDGNFSLIGSGQVLYSQNQGFLTTMRCDNGAACGWSDWTPASEGLPDNGMSNASMAVYPDGSQPYTLASQGDELYFTGNGGLKWVPRGPKGSPTEPPSAQVKGSVTRVVMGPDFVVAGTSQGQIWLTAMAGTKSSTKWHLLYEHDYAARVHSLFLAPTPPTEPKILYVVLASSDPVMSALLRLERDPFDWLDWKAQNITGNFPTSNCSPMVISADAHSQVKAYIGTQSGVFRGVEAGAQWSWVPYNDGLPLAEVTDLLLAPNGELRAATYGRGAWRVITGPPPP